MIFDSVVKLIDFGPSEETLGEDYVAGFVL